MQESIYSPLPSVSHLRKNAPNILIVLIEDVGPAQTDTYGGEIHTPTLSKIAHDRVVVSDAADDALHCLTYISRAVPVKTALRFCS